MADILFGQSYFMRFDPKLWEAMHPYPPLGTLYAASYIRSRGYQVALFDAMLADSEAEWDAALAQHRPKLVVIYEDNFNYLSKMCLLQMRQTAFNMIALARQRGCLVVVAGSDASDHPEEYLAQGAGFVILGEGEATLGELVDHLFARSQQHLSEILGLVYMRPRYRDTGGRVMEHTQAIAGVEDAAGCEIVANPSRPELRTLDDLPFPAWDLVDVTRYREIWQARHGYFSMNVATTRGCPFHCNWCAKPIWGQRYNARSPENVAAELKWLKETYHPDHIWFVDDIFGLQPGWIERFARAVQANGARTPFKCLNRADLLLRPGEIEALKQAGCRIVWIGAESGSQKVLDAMDKGIRVEQIYAASRGLRSAGIQVGFFLQFGYPGETRQDIALTFKMVRECRPDDIGMSVSYPLPGTPFYDMVKTELGARQNWIDSNDLAMLYQGPFNTAFYRQLHRVLHGQFRARRAWRGLRQGGEKPAWKYLARWLREIARVPFERLKLEIQARRPHAGIASLPMRMQPEEAARPSGGER
jgi:anaerobic magnesium-protoporphyrin IX monomethyl ester cyclase